MGGHVGELGGQFSRASEATFGRKGLLVGEEIEVKLDLLEVVLLGVGAASQSEVPGAGVAVVVQLLLDVDHVSTGLFQLPELRSAAEVSKVAELWQPRPGWSICRKQRGVIKHTPYTLQIHDSNCSGKTFRLKTFIISTRGSSTVKFSCWFLYPCAFILKFVHIVSSTLNYTKRPWHRGGAVNL